MIEDEDIEIEDTQREDRHDLMMRLLMWREKHINEHNFVLILSFIIGICTAAAALILKFLIHFIQQLLTSHFNADSANYLYLIYPIIGILLAGLYVRYIVKDDISHGVTRILYAISQKKSRLKPHNMYTSVIASSITIGFGGSVGAEAPIVYTGAAIGSNIGRLFRLDQRLLMLLVGCGAAAAIAGIFKAPIAGILFTLEVLMIDMTATSVLPLLISSITAVTVSYIFTGYNAEFSFVQTEPFVAARIPYVIFLGFFCGFVSLYFTRIMNRMEDIFRRIGTPWKKFILGSLILSCSIFLLPPLYGEAAMAPYYAGDALTMIDENPDLAFVSPEEGVNFFVDSMCIPASSKHKEAAEMFINFMCEPDVGYQNCDFIGYSTPITEVWERLDDDLKYSPIAYPSDEVMNKAEVFVTLPDDINAEMDAKWSEMKSYDESGSGWLIVEIGRAHV